MTVMLGVDPHKASHTVVATDPVGRQLTHTTTRGTRSSDHQELIGWPASAGRSGPGRSRTAGTWPVGRWPICWPLESRSCWCLPA